MCPIEAVRKGVRQGLIHCGEGQVRVGDSVVV